MKTTFPFQNYIKSFHGDIHNISINISHTKALINTRKDEAQAIITNLEVISYEYISNKNIGKKEENP